MTGPVPGEELLRPVERPPLGEVRKLRPRAVHLPIPAEGGDAELVDTVTTAGLRIAVVAGELVLEELTMDFVEENELPSFAGELPETELKSPRPPWPHGESLGHFTELELRELMPWQSITRNGEELGVTIQKTSSPLGAVYRLVARRVGELQEEPHGQSTMERELAQTSIDPWKHRSRGMKCRTCMWWAPKAPDPSRAPARRELGQGAVGRCRRHAPSMSGYPVVFETDWCGDHKLDESK